MLEKEFQYYLDHQAELVRKYNGKFLVIKDNNVVGSYNTKDEAYYEGQKENELGTFLIQFCTPGNMAYTQSFYSLNVSF